MMTYYIECAVGTVLIAIGVFVLGRDWRRPLYRAFCLFTCGLGFWSISLSLLFITGKFFFSQYVFYSEFPIFTGLLFFSLLYPNRTRLPRYAWPSIIPLAVLTACSSTHLFIKGIAYSSTGAPIPINGPFINVFAVVTVVYLLASFFILVSHFRGLIGRQRIQMWYLVSAICVTLVVSTAVENILPSLGIFTFIALGPVSFIFMCSVIAYAIVRHELFDIRVVIQRGLIYTSLLVLIVAAYLLILNFFGSLFGEQSNAVFFSALVTTIFGIFTVPRGEAYFRRVTDKVFFKDKYDYAEALHSLSECLYASIDISHLINNCQDNVKRILRAEHVLMLPYPEQDVGAILVVPIMLDNAIISNLFLGPKRSGDPYTAEDLTLLQTFAYQASTALARAMLYTEVKQHAAQLEEKVTERTEELRKVQENQRQLMLDISHGLQTPLTVIQIKVEQLKHILPGDAQLQQFEALHTDISNFIHSLLKLAQLDYGRDGVAFNALSLSELAEEVIEEVRIIASTSGIRVRSTIEKNVYIRGDSKKLREVLMNLASNSIKYMRVNSAKEVIFSLSTNDQEAVLVVADTGIGISVEDMPYIFERFYRVQHSSGRISGNGLGLAISKRIIEHHGGTIEAASNDGQGTRMDIRFPLIP